MAIAHTKNHLGRTHDLADHLKAASELAGRFAEAFGASEAARRLGLWHDVGKFHPSFQQYLAGQDEGKTWSGRSPDHKAAGSQLALESLDFELAALVIQGHHGGLKNPQQFGGWLQDKREDRPDAIDTSIRLASDAIEDLIPSGGISLPDFALKDNLSAEFFVRFLFSCLVDADFLDTEAHFHPDRSEARGGPVTMRDLWERFMRDQEELLNSAQAGPVNEVRSSVYEDSLNAAELEPGLFRLAVPTGGGEDALRDGIRAQARACTRTEPRHCRRPVHNDH